MAERQMIGVAALIIGIALLCLAAGYCVARWELVDFYEAELAERQAVIDALLPSGVKVVP